MTGFLKCTTGLLKFFDYLFRSSILELFYYNYLGTYVGGVKVYGDCSSVLDLVMCVGVEGLQKIRELQVEERIESDHLPVTVVFTAGENNKLLEIDLMAGGKQLPKDKRKVT